MAHSLTHRNEGVLCGGGDGEGCWRVDERLVGRENKDRGAIARQVAKQNLAHK